MANETHSFGYLALPEAGYGPGILLLHAWWGLNDFFRSLADDLAHEGYVVLAADLNNGDVVRTVEDAQALMERRDYAKLAQTVLDAHDALHRHPAVRGERQGVVGFSMGAAWAIWLSAERPADVAAVVLFYGSNPVDFTVAQAAYLGHYLEDDSWEPLADVRQMEQAMREAGRTVEFHIYPNAAHWFIERDRPEYDAAAAMLAWQRTTSFLNQQLVQPEERR